MATVWRRLGLAALAVLFAAGIAGAYWLLFQAGCAGDSKSGSIGDPVRSLHLEALALLPFSVGLVSLVAMVGMFASWSDLIPFALGFAGLAGACLWIFGVQIEAWGIRACL